MTTGNRRPPVAATTETGVDSTPTPDSTAVLGAGSWGTALAIALSRSGHHVRLWARNAEQARTLREQRCNTRMLPGFEFPPGLDVSADLAAAVAGAGIVVLSVPAQAAAEVLAALAPLRMAGSGLVCTAKGFDAEGRLMDTLAARALGVDTRFAVLSGPTFAAELAAGYPAAVTVAAREAAFAAQVAGLFRSEWLRVYTSDDVIGVEVGGAVKNVLAIAAGIVDGLGFGANTRAALITRGLAELMRLGEALGGRRETLMGLAGLGDLVLTCTDDKSRNRRFGLALARGASAAQAAREVGQVVEGAGAAAATVAIAERLGVQMPIAEQVLAVVDGRRTPRAAVHALLERTPREGEFQD